MAFKDFSKNNFQLTAFGNAQISTAQKKYGDGSAYFDGTGDYVQTIIPNWNVGVSGEPFTIEFWAYKLDTNTGVFLTKHGGVVTWNGTNGINFHFYATSSNLVFGFYGGSEITINNSTAIPTNQWVHLAVTYDGTTTRVFVDGALQPVTSTTSYQAVTNANILQISGEVGNNFLHNGYIDDLRITKGIARYTSNFTPPQTQLPTITDPYYSNVSLLMPMNLGPFTDSSTNNFELTAFGNADLSTTVKKYGTASGSFNGTDSYIDVDGLPNDYLSNDFTIEGWFWINATNSSYRTVLNTFPHNTLAINLNGDGIGKTNIFIGNGSNWIGVPAIASSSNLTLNTWNHLALVRYNNTITLYHNGVAQGSTNIMPSGASTKLRIGAYSLGVGEVFNGYIDDLRITKGIARYTSNFTQPTSELPRPSDPNGDNVSLLLHMDGDSGSQTFTDSSSNNFTLSAFGNAQISTSVKKFGSGSAYFDGNGDYVEIPADATITGTIDFTMECWVYPLTLTPSSGYTFIYGFKNQLPNGNFSFGYTTGGFLFTATAWNGIDNTANTNPLTINEWNHIALTRTGGRLRGFVNGVKCIDSANTNNYPSGKIGAIGGDYGGNPNFNGYIDDLRITKGVARYTSNFVPQTAPFANPQFSPKSIPGLQLWLDGSDASTMYDATVGGSLVAADGAIARWEDKSGNDKHATQSTSNNRPLRRLSQQNGLDGVEFDGNDDFVEGTQVLNALPYTVIVVCKFTDNTEIGSYFGQKTGDIPTLYRWGFGGERLRIFNGTDLTSNSSVSNETWYTIRNVGNSASSQIYINNTLDITGQAGTGTPGGDYVIGKWFAGNQAQGVTFGEVIVYNKVLTTEEAAKVEEYLNNKWGVY